MTPRTSPKTDIERLAPAVRSTRRPRARMMVLTSPGAVQHTTVDQLAGELCPGDVVVVNDAATMPSRLVGTLTRTGQQIELRLASHLGARPNDVSGWLAVSIGHAPNRVRTEDREPGVRVEAGDRIQFGGTLTGTVKSVVDTPAPSRGLLFEIEFASRGGLFRAIHEAARPIQYAHLVDRLEDWDQQTIFSGPAVAVEPPSSGFHLTWQLYLELRHRGIEVASITHATGLSTTGNQALDRLLPLPEYSYIPKSAARAIEFSKARGSRVVAIGTGVARALESSVVNGSVQSGRFMSLTRLCPNNPPEVVDGLLSGLHEPGSSHLALLESFVDSELLNRAYAEAEVRGYLGHEYGDLELVFRDDRRSS